MNELRISEIQIIPLKPKEGLVAFASCVVNKALYIGNIAIYTSPSTQEGFRLVYPVKTLPNGKEIHCVDRTTSIPWRTSLSPHMES